MEEQKPVLPSKALGIFMDKDGSWYVVRVPYNGVTGEVGPPEKISDGTGKLECEMRFKVKVIEEKVF